MGFSTGYRLVFVHVQKELVTGKLIFLETAGGQVDTNPFFKDADVLIKESFNGEPPHTAVHKVLPEGFGVEGYAVVHHFRSDGVEAFSGGFQIILDFVTSFG